MPPKNKQSRRGTRGGARPGAGRPTEIDGPSVVIGFRIPAALRAALAAEAKARGISLNALCRERLAGGQTSA